MWCFTSQTRNLRLEEAQELLYIYIYTIPAGNSGMTATAVTSRTNMNQAPWPR